MFVVNESVARNVPVVVTSPLDAKREKRKGNGRLTVANAAFLRSLGFVVPKTAYS